LDTGRLVERAQLLGETRQRLASARSAAAVAELELRVARARAEQRIIDSVGGEKGMGPNEEARKRLLIIKLDDDAEYSVKLTDRLEADRVVRDLEADMLNLADELTVADLLLRDAAIQTQRAIAFPPMAVRLEPPGGAYLADGGEWKPVRK